MNKSMVKVAVISCRCLVLSFFVGLLFLTTIWYSHGHATDLSMQSNSPTENWTLCENWTLKQVASGDIADLQRFAKESDRVLSARFLEELLANSAGKKVHRRGVRIANAIITEPIDLTLAEIQCETRLINFLFEENVNFSQSIFLKGLSCVGCSFKYANFNSMEVDGSTNFQDTTFSGEAIFEEADINGDFVSTNTSFTDATFFYGMKVGRDANFDNSTFDRPVVFTNMEVGRDAYFWNTVFSSEAIFAKADINGDFVSINTSFSDAAYFKRLRVGGSADFRNTTFSSRAMFVDAEIQDDFSSLGANFNDATLFYGMKVGRDANFKDAIFTGLADFSSIEVGGDADFWNTVFSSNVTFSEADINGNFKSVGANFTEVADLNRMKVGCSAYFRDAIFSSEVTFSEADINGNFESSGANFTDVADLNRMKVGGSAYFRDAVFSSEAKFEEADIYGDFESSGANFTAKANFSGMKVGCDANFEDAIFTGTADFTRIAVGRNAYLTRTKFIVAKFTEADIDGNFESVGANFSGRAYFIGTKVGYSAFFEDTIFGKYINMQRSEFTDIYFNKMTWPEKEKSIYLDWMTYQNIQAGSEEESWEKLMELVARAEYNPNVYANLEAFYKSRGEITKADEVFVAQKLRERAQLPGGPKNFHWWVSLYLDYLKRYGLQPYRPFLGAIIFLIIGAVVFRGKYMRQKAEKNPHPNDKVESPLPSYMVERLRPRYSSFWYSLDLFIPLIDLKTANVWEPDPKSPHYSFRKNWQLIHQIGGYVIILIYFGFERFL